MAVSPSKKAPAKSTTTAAPKRVVRKVAPKTTGSVVQSAVLGEVSAFVPNIEKAKSYVHRDVHGVNDFAVLDHAMATRKNVLVMGDTGAGKTLWGEAFAAERGYLYYSLACDVAIDPSALMGRMVPTEVAGKYEWQDGPVTQIVRTGGVLNISEVNFMPPKIAASLYPLLDGRRYLPLLGHKGEVVHAHENLLVIADMNPQYRGTIELNAAFKNRFELKVMWGYDNNVERQLVKLPSLLAIANKIRKMVGVEVSTPVSTNALMEFEALATDTALGVDFAIGNFIAAFGADERDAIRNVIELERDSLNRELAYVTGTNTDDFDEVVGFDYSDAEYVYEQ